MLLPPGTTLDGECIVADTEDDGKPNFEKVLKRLNMTNNFKINSTSWKVIMLPPPTSLELLSY